METVIKSKTVLYKRAVISGNHATLQDMLTSALKEPAASKAAGRKELINQGSDSCRLVNRTSIVNGMLFGQLLYFEPGTSQSLVTLDDNAEFFEIDAVTTQSLGQDANVLKKQKEFVNSILYFGVLDNHVVLVQSAALRARDLETHLGWFLGTLTQKLGSGNALILQDKPAEATIAKLEKEPVKSIVLGAPVEAAQEQQAVMSTEVVTSTELARQVKWVPKGLGSKVLSAVLGDGWFSDLKLEDSLDESNIHVSLEISYRRKTDVAGQKVVDSIATSLRHTEASDVKIKLYGGGEISGSDLKLSGPIKVRTINGTVDESDLFQHMHQWMVTKVSTSEIEVMATSK